MAVNTSKRLGLSLVLAVSAAGLAVMVLSTSGQAQTCDDPDWAALDGEVVPLCTLLLLDDPLVARTDCASMLAVSGSGAELDFSVSGIGAARFRVLERQAEADEAARLLRRAAACYASEACMTDTDGAVSVALGAVAHEPGMLVVGQASLDLRRIAETGGSSLFGDVDDLVPPSADLSVVRAGEVYVLMLRTRLGPFDDHMSGPTSVAVLEPETGARLCPE